MSLFKKLTLLLLLMGTYACKEKQNKKVEANHQVSDSLQLRLTVLNDSLSKAWSDLIASDDQKITYIRTFTQEIAQVKGYNKALAHSIIQLNESLPSKRYQNVNSFTHEQVDAYDAISDSAVNMVKNLYQQSGSSCASCTDLVNRITSIDNAVIIYKVRYDGHAKEYNAFINEHKQKLANLKPEYQHLAPKPLFQLMPQ